MTRSIPNMVAVLNGGRPNVEIGNSDLYNRLELQRAIAKGAEIGEAIELNGAGELLRVLIVDDYRDSADAFSMLVNAWGHEVRRAYDGPTALALAAALQPHMLLFDVVMPGMSGLELVTQVRRQPEMDDCLMVALTGWTDAAHRQVCVEAGVDLYLLKPLEPSVLQTLLTWKAAQVLRPMRHEVTPQPLGPWETAPQDLELPNERQVNVRVERETVAS